MNELIRSAVAAATLTLAFTSTFLAGCATSRSFNRAAMLSLPYEQFDQTFGSGWRSLFDRREYGKSARLIEDYLQTHNNLTVGQQKFLHLHAGMSLALEGSTSRAVKHLDQAMTARKLPELWPDWNDFVAANRAFLMHDRSSLQATRERLAADHSRQLIYVDRLLQTFGSSYTDFYWWARVCPKVVVAKETSPEVRAAAEKLAKTFAASFSVADNNAPQPSCVWVEVRDFSPNSFAMGYVIIHSADGTQITASNEYWLEAAIDRFINSSRERGDFREAPFGLTTSFNLAVTPPPTNDQIR